MPEIILRSHNDPEITFANNCMVISNECKSMTKNLIKKYYTQHEEKAACFFLYNNPKAFNDLIIIAEDIYSVSQCKIAHINNKEQAINSIRIFFLKYNIAILKYQLVKTPFIKRVIAFYQPIEITPFPGGEKEDVIVFPFLHNI